MSPCHIVEASNFENWFSTATHHRRADSYKLFVEFGIYHEPNGTGVSARIPNIYTQSVSDGIENPGKAAPLIIRFLLNSEREAAAGRAVFTTTRFVF